MPPPTKTSRIAREGGVVDLDRATKLNNATAVTSRIAREGGAVNGERATLLINATAVISRIAREGGVRDGERATSLINGTVSCTCEGDVVQYKGPTTSNVKSAGTHRDGIASPVDGGGASVEGNRTSEGAIGGEGVGGAGGDRAVYGIRGGGGHQPQQDSDEKNVGKMFHVIRILMKLLYMR